MGLFGRKKKKEKIVDINNMRIFERYREDVGRAVARIDYDSMNAINANTGDTIEITGKRRTVARCLPLNSEDQGYAIIRMDWIGRNNSGTELGDTISIRKITPTAAEKIVVFALQAIPPLDERYLTDALEGVPLIKADNVMIPYFGEYYTFQAVSVTPPSEAVIVTQKTSFHIAEAAKPPSEEEIRNGERKNLQRADLDNMDLSGADLSGANLTTCFMDNLDLSGVDLKGADLHHTTFKGVNLSGADLRGADFYGTILNDVNLSGANLSGTDLSTDRSGADLKGFVRYSNKLDMSGADLSGADLSGADLRGANLRGANLNGANLNGANLNGTDLTGVDLTGVDLDAVRNISLDEENANYHYETDVAKIKNLTEQLLEQIPELTREIIEQKITEWKEKIGGGYLTDEGALYLIASECNVKLEKTSKTEITKSFRGALPKGFEAPKPAETKPAETKPKGALPKGFETKE